MTKAEPSSRRTPVRILAGVAVLLALGACAPKIIAGTEQTVTIKSGPRGSMDKLAESYCQDFGKHAVPLGGGRASPNAMQGFYSYNCVEPEQ